MNIIRCPSTEYTAFVQFVKKMYWDILISDWSERVDWLRSADRLLYLEDRRILK